MTSWIRTSSKFRLEFAYGTGKDDLAVLACLLLLGDGLLLLLDGLLLLTMLIGRRQRLFYQRDLDSLLLLTRAGPLEVAAVVSVALVSTVCGR
jgi:hypothetical protein